MFAYIVRRILATIPVMIVVALFVFALLHLSPGDPAAIIAGDTATPADIARIRQMLGLDQPLYLQFGHWVWQLLHGDLGISIFTNMPVSELIAQRIEPTAALGLSTLVLSVLMAIPLGVLAAWKAGSWIDRSVMVFAVLGFSVPVFVLAYILIYVFSIGLAPSVVDGLAFLPQSVRSLLASLLAWHQQHLLPVQGYVSICNHVTTIPIDLTALRLPVRTQIDICDGFARFLPHIILPSVALGAIYAALIARITRASMLDVLAQDYIRTAQAKGLGTEKVLIGHALKNAAVPIATIIGIGIALLIGGQVVTETVFAIPGVGRLTVDAILRRDYPIIQGIILIFSAVYVVVNLVIDLSYTFLDPRIRY